MSYATLGGSEQPVPRDAHQNTEALVKDLVLPLIKHRLLQLQKGLSADSLQPSALKWGTIAPDPCGVG